MTCVHTWVEEQGSVLALLEAFWFDFRVMESGDMGPTTGDAETVTSMIGMYTWYT